MNPRLELADETVSERSDISDKDAYQGGRMKADILERAAVVDLGPLMERTRQSIRDAVPSNTRRAYEGDLRRFADWSSSAGLPAMPVQRPSGLRCQIDVNDSPMDDAVRRRKPSTWPD
jgi:hypothetical protein